MPTRLLPLLIAVSLLLPGCGVRNFENQNDELRAQNLHLKREVEALQHKLALRVSELEAMRQTTGPPSIEGADPPRLADITLGRYTAAIDTNDDGVDDRVRVYLWTLDHQGRFLPVAARATVQVVAIGPDQPPTVLAERTYDAPAFDQAYRSGYFGTHYTLEADLIDTLPPHAMATTVKVTLTEAVTGKRFTAQQPLAVSR